MHAAKVLEHDAHGIDATGANKDIRRIWPVGKRANEQTVASGRERVKGKSAETIGRRRYVGRARRITRKGRKDRIVRQRAARICQCSNETTEARPDRRRLWQSR